MRVMPKTDKGKIAALLGIFVAVSVFVARFFTSGVVSDILAWVAVAIIVGTVFLAVGVQNWFDQFVIDVKNHVKYKVLIEAKVKNEPITKKDAKFIKRYQKAREEKNIRLAWAFAERFIKNPDGEPVYGFLISNVPAERVKETYSLTESDVIAFDENFRKAYEPLSNFLEAQKQKLQSGQVADIVVEFVLFTNQVTGTITTAIKPSTVEQAMLGRNQAMVVDYVVFTSANQIDQFSRIIESKLNKITF